MCQSTHSAHRVVLAAALSIAWSSAARAQPAWVPTDIGTLGLGSVARAVNNHGVVMGNSLLVGDASTTRGNRESTLSSSLATPTFLWTARDGMVDIGTMGGLNASGSDINDAGQVVGAANAADGEWHAFVWSAATGFIDICPGSAIAINNLGMVVGECKGHGPIMWSASEGIVDLGTIPGVVNAGYTATDVNDAGTVVGRVSLPCQLECGGGNYPFVWTRSGGMAFVSRSIGGLGPSVRINNRGDILWEYNVWPHDGGGPVGIGFSGGDLNNRGQVAGPAGISTVGGVWSADRGVIELGSIFGVRGNAYSINDAGLIVGWADEATSNGTFSRAIVWRPRQDLAIDFG